MRLIPLLFLAVISVSCSVSSKEDANYFEFDKSKKLARLTNKKLEEVSGLAPSLRNEKLLWTHNDSGNDAEVFLINDSLNIELTCRLKGIENRDWEDIAVGPGPDSTKSYVYVGDIGDNVGRYNYKMIYRFVEPDFKTLDTNFVEITDFDTITFELPDERKDTETLMIDPKTTDLFIVSKREKPVTVYRIPNQEITTTPVVAEKVGSFNREYVVGGSISPDGQEVLLKNIDNVYYWKLESGETLADVFKREPKILTYKREAQGEAIAFKFDGSGFYTLSELKSGEKSFLRFYARKKESVRLTGEKPD